MNPRQHWTHGFLCVLAVVMRLQIEPYFRWPSKILRQPQRRVRRDGTIALHDFIYTTRRHADVFGKPVFGQAQRLQEVFAENFARVNGGVLFHVWVSVIIYDLNIMRPVRRPSETNAPLVVDTDRALPRTSALEPLQPVARRDGHLRQLRNGVNLRQFPKRHPLYR